MKILVQLFPGSKLEVIEVDEPDFKRVPDGNGGYRLRSSVWSVDYSHLDSESKKFLANKAELINKKLNEITALEQQVSRLKKYLKETYCRTNKGK